jgi:hypothetical protein
VWLPALDGMATKLDLQPSALFVDGKMFTQAPVQPNMMVFERHIDKLELIDPKLTARVILWFCTYAGLQHILWQVIQRVERNDQASAVIRKGLEAWSVAARDALELIADLEK